MVFVDTIRWLLRSSWLSAYRASITGCFFRSRNQSPEHLTTNWSPRHVLCLCMKKDQNTHFLSSSRADWVIHLSSNWAKGHPRKVRQKHLSRFESEPWLRQTMRIWIRIHVRQLCLKPRRQAQCDSHLWGFQPRLCVEHRVSSKQSDIENSILLSQRVEYSCWSLEAFPRLQCSDGTIFRSRPP